MYGPEHVLKLLTVHLLHHTIVLNTLRLLVPVVQAQVENDLYNLSAKWTDEDGLCSKHTIKVGYTYNDEKLALLQGERQQDGSYVYVSPKGRVHHCPADKAAAYIKAQAERQSQYNTWKQRQAAQQQPQAEPEVEPVTVTVEA